MAKLVVCPNCGANVDAASAPPSATFMQCTYCESTIQLDRPPPPRQQQQIPQIQIVINGPGDASGYARSAAKAGGGAAIASLAIGLFVLVLGGAIAWSAMRSAGIGPSFGPTRLPANCSINGTIRVEDQTLVLKETAIKANMNCKIFITRSKITAPKIIDGNANVEVTIEDSTLIAEDTAIELNANGKVKMTGKSLISAEDVAIKTNMNGEIRMEGGEIKSEETAISSNVNGKLDAKGGKITGGKTALSFSMNGSATLRDTEVKGAKDMGMNGKIKEK